jgi:hypothetical protein
MVLSQRIKENNAKALVVFHDKNKRYQPKPTPSSVLVAIPKVDQTINLTYHQTMGRIMVYNKTNILACSNRIMHVIHTSQETTHINLGSRQGDQITLCMIFNVTGVLKKGIWSMSEIKAMVDRVKDLEFHY